MKALFVIVSIRITSHKYDSFSSFPVFVDLELKSDVVKWKFDGQTIAGGNEKGDQLNQLSYPWGIYVDQQQQHIYIADCGNNRILKWKLGENEGQIVAGGNGQGTQIDQLNMPTDVILDKKNKSLIICDCGNRRVVRWSLKNRNGDKEILIENISCFALMMNENGDLFISDWENHSVRRWRKGEIERIVAGGNGQGNQLNQLNKPTNIFIDREETVYVSDWKNHRVMKWLKGAKEGIVVAGGQGKGNSLKQLNRPNGLVVNEVGDVYVTGYRNHRIMCWPLGSKEGRVVVGGNGKGKESNQLYHPTGLSFDVENNLYVVDSWNHRIQRFNSDRDSMSILQDKSSDLLLVSRNHVMFYMDSFIYFQSQDHYGISIKTSEHYSSSPHENISQVMDITTHLRPRILIVHLKINTTLIAIDPKYSIESFDDECTCTYKILSITDTRVYLVVSKSVSNYVVPLIHESECVEQIYIYCEQDITESEDDLLWQKQFSKIKGFWTDYNSLVSAINADIQSINAKSFHWTNFELLYKCHTQTLLKLSDQSSICLNTKNIERYTNADRRICLVVLHCDSKEVFSIKSERFHLAEFTKVTDCVNYLEENNGKTIFLIISGQIQNIIHALTLIDTSKLIYVLYIFVASSMDTKELNETLIRYKSINRLFDNRMSLLCCLNSDIKSYIESQLYIPTQLLFSHEEMTKIESIRDLNRAQETFAAHLLLLRQIFRETQSSSVIVDEVLIDRCYTLAETESDAERVKQKISNDKIDFLNWFSSDSFLFIVTNSFSTEEFPQNLLRIKHFIMKMNKYFTGVKPTTSHSTVYRVQLMQADDLKRITENTHGLIVLLSYMIVTTDFVSIRTIAREIDHHGLIAVLFQIDLPSQTQILKLDNERSLLQFASIFRIRSVKQGPDNVWYCQLKYSDSVFEQIHLRIKLNVHEPLNQFTLGKYFCSLNYTHAAKIYFENMITEFKDNDQALGTIYNNLGLIYAQLDDHEYALKCYEKSEALLSKLVKNSQDTEQSKSSHNSPLESEQLQCYRQAVKLLTDPLERFEYELKIQKILSLKINK